jgi:hypothetical protein
MAFVCVLSQKLPRADDFFFRDCWGANSKQAESRNKERDFAFNSRQQRIYTLSVAAACTWGSLAAACLPMRFLLRARRNNYRAKFQLKERIPPHAG